VGGYGTRETSRFSIDFPSLNPLLPKEILALSEGASEKLNKDKAVFVMAPDKRTPIGGTPWRERGLRGSHRSYSHELIQNRKV